MEFPHLVLPLRRIIGQLGDLKQFWWERWPNWYEFELAELHKCEGVVQVEVARESGCLILEMQYEYNGGILPLCITCGAYYPFFPPSIKTPGHQQSRHRGYTREDLCFLAHDANGDHQWMPFTDTVAGILTTQLPKALQISDMAAKGELDPANLAGEEMEVGEPATAFLFGCSEGGILIDDVTIPKEDKKGKFSWQLDRVFKGSFEETILGSAIHIFDSKNNEYAALDDKNVYLLPDKPLQTASWFRADLPEEIIDKSQLWPWLRKSHSLKAEKLIKGVRKKTGSVGLLGVLLNEEVSHLKQGDSWIYFAAVNINNDIKLIVARGLRSSQSEMRLRVPELNSLLNKKVLLVGLGSIGSPVALQLAKAGVGVLHLIDKDIVGPGNTVRWAFGMKAVGHHKATYLASYIRHNYPMVSVEPEHMHIGNPNDAQPIVEKLLETINDVDLVIDATASIEVNDYLSRMCKLAGTTFQWLSTTEGAYGGIVGRVIPGNGCWMEYFRRLGSEINLPYLKKGKGPVPKGCITPTFTGAGIDCEQVGLFAARMAISTLCNGEKEGYPSLEWDVGVFNFRNESGEILVAPIWETHSLNCSDDCEYCGKSDA